jgi:hypothetical protein
VKPRPSGAIQDAINLQQDAVRADRVIRSGLPYRVLDNGMPELLPRRRRKSKRKQK